MEENLKLFIRKIRFIYPDFSGRMLQYIEIQDVVTEKQYEVLVLFLFWGKSLNEIARTKNVTPSAIYSRYRDATESLARECSKIFRDTNS